MNATHRLRPCARPLLISVPHAGVLLPEPLAARLRPAARALPDTDWFVDRLFERAGKLGAGLLAANYSRYVIDLNRPPDAAALYPSVTTGLVPLQTFCGQPVYAREDQPDSREIHRRLEHYWQPYHRALGRELERVRRKFGYALLLDAHSIRRRVPRLFDGRLPDLNLGSFHGASAGRGLVDAVVDELRAHEDYTCVLDGRFVGGYITRHYGKPAAGIHALQLEMAQSIYMQEQPPRICPHSLPGIQGLLDRVVARMLEWSPENE